jgi:hypothetical protein
MNTILYMYSGSSGREIKLRNDDSRWIEYQISNREKVKRLYYSFYLFFVFNKERAREREKERGTEYMWIVKCQLYIGICVRLLFYVYSTSITS